MRSNTLPRARSPNLAATNPRARRAARLRRAQAALVAAADLHFGDGAAARARNALGTALREGDRWLESGADGLGAAQLLSSATDTVLSAMFDHACATVPGGGKDRFAILATGGYGRGVLAPHSDIDLLFLHAGGSGGALIETTLHMLWDLGPSIGHAYRTPAECVAMARCDHTARTAMLDRRLIAGNPALARELDELLEREEAAGSMPDFVRDKLRERELRHHIEGNSRYRVEPDVKNGKGGLRDLQTLFWIARHLHGGTDLELVLRGPGFSANDAQRFRNQARFIWAVRWHLHRMTGRATERISFDLQPELAVRMGYGGRRALSGVERVMKRYFLATREVGALTRVLCARLEAQDRAEPRGLFGILPPPAPRDIPDFPQFARHAGRVVLRDRVAMRNDPVNAMRLFAVADRTGLDIHPDAMEEIRNTYASFRAAWRTDDEVRGLFLRILTESRQPARTLELMNEAGLLGRLIPEFGRIVAQTQYNMYHHYTVDDHTLRAIGILNDLESRRMAVAHPLETRVFPTITHRRALYLAMLLHDTGKGQGDQQTHGARNARIAALRLGLPESEAELVAWLVGHHLEMSNTARRRDLSDPATIARFTALVGSVERLRLLLLMTVADIRAVGPSVWNEWKRHLLTTLYEQSAVALRGGRAGVASGLVEQRRIRAAKARDRVRRKMRTPPTALNRIEDAYWTAFAEDELLWQAHVLAAAEKDNLPVIAAARDVPDTDSTSLLIFAPDVDGLLAGLAAAIARFDATAVETRLYPCGNGCALDLFDLQSGDGGPLCADTRARMVGALRAAAAAPVKPARAPAPGAFRPRRTSAFIVPAEIALDRNSSADHLIVEVAALDRPGLMRDVALVIAAQRLSVVSAHAEIFGARAHQVFYVADDDGGCPPAELDGDLSSALAAAIRSEQSETPRIPSPLRRAAVSSDR